MKTQNSQRISVRRIFARAFAAIAFASALGVGQARAGEVDLADIDFSQRFQMIGTGFNLEHLSFAKTNFNLVDKTTGKVVAPDPKVVSVDGYKEHDRILTFAWDPAESGSQLVAVEFIKATFKVGKEPKTTLAAIVHRTDDTQSKLDSETFYLDEKESDPEENNFYFRNANGRFRLDH